MDHLPIFLKLQAQPVLLVGGGRTAVRKLELLLACGAQVTIVAPELHEQLRLLRWGPDLRHVARKFAPSDLDGVVVAVAATDDPDVNAAVATAARARHIPVNVVDDAGLSSFIFPAIIDRAPLTVAVSSAGHSPVLARWLREQIEALLPGEIGTLARFLGRRRRQVHETLEPAARRPFWERIVRGVTATHLLAGRSGAAEDAFLRELRTAKLTAGASAMGEVYLIGAGPGDPDLLTLKALQLLQQADVILHDRLVSPAVLARARRDALKVFVGKAPGVQGSEQATQEHIHELLLEHARQGLRVARLKGGDPFIFGRGGEEAELLARHGIPCIVVPGITAALGAAASAGIPLTHRQVSRSVTLVTGHDLDVLDFRALAGPGQTVVFYMGVSHLEEIALRLCAAGAAPSCPATVIESATLAQERVLCGTLATIAGVAQAHAVSSPSLLIVGEVAAFAGADALLARAATLTGALSASATPA
jgi:uroporphyrin-III C-methyltransferase/precorrin-2 dehydrogenase/sirohydrochlorin ferrochelatase